MVFETRPANPAPRPELRRPRGSPADIRQIQWHATRGSTAMDRQVQATEGWFASPQNLVIGGGAWGGSADWLVGPDYRTGKVEIVQFGNWWETYSSWSAGYGNAGTQPAAPYGVAIEVAQPAGKDANGNWTGDPNATYEAFTPETIDACVWLVGHINEGLRALGVPEIPPVHIEWWGQEPGEIPRGHIGHDELANGRKLGKSDPGALFPWDELMRRIEPTQGLDDFQRGRKEMFDAWLGDIESYAEHVKSLREAWGIPA